MRLMSKNKVEYLLPVIIQLMENNGMKHICRYYVS